jgi:hypothetical protein
MGNRPLQIKTEVLVCFVFFLTFPANFGYISTESALSEGERAAAQSTNRQDDAIAPQVAVNDTIRIQP